MQTLVAAAPLVPSEDAMFYGLAIVRAAGLAQLGKHMAAIELVAQVSRSVPDKGYASYLTDWLHNGTPHDASDGATFPVAVVLQCLVPVFRATTGRTALFPSEAASLRPWSSVLEYAWQEGWLAATPAVILAMFSGLVLRTGAPAVAVDMAATAHAHDKSLATGVGLGLFVCVFVLVFVIVFLFLFFSVFLCSFLFFSALLCSSLFFSVLLFFLSLLFNVSQHHRI